MGTKSLRGPKARGEIFANYLILTGVARFLIEFIRINDRSFFGMSNAQSASLLSILVGAVLLWRIKGQFHSLKKEHRIVEPIAPRGDVLQPASAGLFPIPTHLSAARNAATFCRK